MYGIVPFAPSAGNAYLRPDKTTKRIEIARGVKRAGELRVLDGSTSNSSL